MGLITITQIEDDTDATANVLNSRFGKIVDEINGHIDSANLSNQAVTEAKIADGAVTSSKLGFEKYTDDNGWLITDLGLVKLATKKRSFTIPTALPGSIGFVSISDNTAPVGFNPSTSFSVNATPYITNGNAYQWNIVFEESVQLSPTSLAVYINVSGNTAVGTGFIETWVIF